MKKFRSSKILKPLDYANKQQNILRARIKLLQQQIERLQQSNLNIYIPLTQHQVSDNQDYQSIINKLRSQIVNLQQQIQLNRLSIKKLQKQNQSIKITYQGQIEKLNKKIDQLECQNKQLKDQLIDINIKIQQKIQQCSKLKNQIVQKNVQIKFLNNDLQQINKLVQFYKNKFQQNTNYISSVQYSSKIYKSLTIKITAIETQELNKLKSRIAQLERQLRDIQNADKLNKINLGIPKKNIGEEIVRLKKNLDSQLGLQAKSNYTDSFLSVYNDTNSLFKKLIDECHK